jgi:hypothetical protein
VVATGSSIWRWAGDTGSGIWRLSVVALESSIRRWLRSLQGVVSVGGLEAKLLKLGRERYTSIIYTTIMAVSVQQGV